MNNPGKAPVFPGSCFTALVTQEQPLHTNVEIRKPCGQRMNGTHRIRIVCYAGAMAAAGKRPVPFIKNNTKKQLILSTLQLLKF
jgi:hypothetical protein